MAEEVWRRQGVRYLLYAAFLTSTLPAREVLLIATDPVREPSPAALLLALVTLLSPLVFSGVWTVQSLTVILSK